MPASISNKSYYQATANRKIATVPLEGDMTADVCIIGAGYTGLSAALELAEAGYKVVVLEAETIGFGASGGTAVHPNHALTLQESTHSRAQRTHQSRIAVGQRKQ